MPKFIGLVLICLSTKIICKTESINFFIGTGLLSSEHLESVKIYPELKPKLEKEIQLENLINHFKVGEKTFSHERVVMEVIKRRATYIYMFYTLGSNKPSFRVKAGNYLEISGFHFSDLKAGKMMEKHHYLDLSRDNNEG